MELRDYTAELVTMVATALVLVLVNEVPALAEYQEAMVGILVVAGSLILGISAKKAALLNSKKDDSQ